jgi:hypothetical protein
VGTSHFFVSSGPAAPKSDRSVTAENLLHVLGCGHCGKVALRCANFIFFFFVLIINSYSESISHQGKIPSATSRFVTQCKRNIQQQNNSPSKRKQNQTKLALSSRGRQLKK